MIENVKILQTEVLSDNWYVLRKITYEYVKKMAVGKHNPGKH